MKGRIMKEKNGEHPFGDAGQGIALASFLVVWIVGSFFLRQSIFRARYIPLFIRLAVFGVALILAILLVRSGHVVVRHGQRPDHVVSTGAFRFVRHPLYLASLLIYFGLTISTASFFSLIVFVAIFIFYNYIAGYEERLLQAKFGGAYSDYMKKTGKWLPRIRRRR